MSQDSPSTEISLQDIARRRCYLVQGLPHRPGGVDFLGLREVNLNMMQRLLPTVNNVVSHVRIYTVLAWAWWRAGELARQRGGDPTPEQIVRFVERVEILFTWSHKLAGKEVGLPGNTAKPPSASGPVQLDLKSWKRAPLTSVLMAPVQYGPSLRFPSGFRYVMPSAGPSNVLVPTESILPAVHSMDRRISVTNHAALLATLDDVRATAIQAATFFPAWRVDVCEPIEAEVFREHFGDPGWRARGTLEGDSRWRRSRTVAFFLDVMRQAARPLTIEELRSAAASHFLPDGRPWEVTADLQPVALTFTLLQARQGQRQALEALFSWVELNLLGGAGHTPDTLSERAAVSLRNAQGVLGRARSLKQIAERLRKDAEPLGSMPHALGRVDSLDLFGLLAKTRDAARDARQGETLLASSIHLLLLSGLLASSLRDESGVAPLFELTPGRIPLKSLVALLEDDRPIEEGLRQILGEMVIGQHLAVAVARNVDDTQRLRISLEEEGLVSLARRPLRPAPTPDRLDNLLPLLAEAGLCQRLQDANATRYTLASDRSLY